MNFVDIVRMAREYVARYPASSDGVGLVRVGKSGVKRLLIAKSEHEDANAENKNPAGSKQDTLAGSHFLASFVLAPHSSPGRNNPAPSGVEQPSSKTEKQQIPHG